MLYEVELNDGHSGKRHQNQLRPRYESSDQSFELRPLSDDLLNRDKEPIQVTLPAQLSPRYPSRHRKPPDRYSP